MVDMTTLEYDWYDSSLEQATQAVLIEPHYERDNSASVQATYKSLQPSDIEDIAKRCRESLQRQIDNLDKFLLT